MNSGVAFSLDEYRKNRTEIRVFLREKLRATLESKYHVKMLDLYMGRIVFSRTIDNLNLLRMLNGIFNEQASYVKETNLIRAETNMKINELKNEVKYTIASAQSNAENQITKLGKINKYRTLELAHLTGLNNSLNQLSFNVAAGQKVDIQKAMSFCYANSLVNNENVRFIDTNKLLNKAYLNLESTNDALLSFNF
jgi:hypothetical protein